MMSLFGRLFGSWNRPRSSQQAPPEQAVIVYLDGRSLPDQVYEEYDTATLIDRLTEILSRDSIGEVDGTESGPSETAVFLYGPDAERIFAGIEPLLREYPLCQGARVVIRRGGPGSVQRELNLGRDASG